MAALIVYESMFGNTHEVADAVGRGLGDFGVVKVVPVSEATPELIESADLLVVGGPTHAHGMVRHNSQASAAEQAAKEGIELDPDAEGEILRDWFDRLPKGAGTPAAAFDTRVDVNPHLSGRASKGIAKRLRAHRHNIVASPESFLVDRHNHLVEGELERAEAWGRDLCSRVRTFI
jgi:hypothetical protein